MLFGEAYTKNGVQVKWVAPTELFMEFGAEMGMATTSPAPTTTRTAAGDYTLFSHFGGDIDVSQQLDGGIVLFVGKPRPRSRKRNGRPQRRSGRTPFFSGSSKNWIANFVWKWAPEGNPTEQNFKFVAEYFWRDEQGNLLCADNLADGGVCDGTDSAYHPASQAAICRACISSCRTGASAIATTG